MKSFRSIFESFQQYSQKKTLLEVKNSVLDEISQGYADKVYQWAADAGPDALPFSNMFGDKKRVIVPMPPVTKSGPIGSLLNFLKMSGWNVDITSGTASKEDLVEIPKGPKAGQKVKKKRVERIGKLIAPLADIRKIDPEGNIIEKEAEFRKLYNSISTEPTPEMEDTFSKFKARLEKRNEAFVRLLKNFDAPNKSSFWSPFEPEGKEFLEQLNLKAGDPKDWVAAWNRDSFKYIENPDALMDESPYSIIVSRAPIDVLRMSDFKNIQSCHSQGGDYFQCAMADAKGQGLVAYVVTKRDLENIDLDADEIFADPVRHVNGIVPVSRVRLRKYSNIESAVPSEHEEMAVPELRVYGDKVPGFLEAVQGWARKSQPNIEPNDISPEEWVRHGGTYSDTNDGAMLAKMFPELKDHFDRMENFEVIDAEEDAEDLNNLQDQVDETESDFRTYARHFSLNSEVIEGEGVNYILASAFLGVDLDKETRERIEISTKELPNWKEHFSELKAEFANALEDRRFYINIEYFDFAEHFEDSNVLNIEFRVEEPMGQIGDYRRFVDYVKDMDHNYDKIMDAFIENLSENGILPSEESQRVRGLSKVANLTNLKIVIKEEEQPDGTSGQMFNIFLKKPIVLDKNPRSFKQFEKEDQAKIKEYYKEFFLRNFDKALTRWSDVGYLVKDLKGTEHDTGLNIDLDGVKLRFKVAWAFDDKQELLTLVRFAKSLDYNFNEVEQLARIAWNGRNGVLTKLTNKVDTDPIDQADVATDAADAMNETLDKRLVNKWRKFVNG